MCESALEKRLGTTFRLMEWDQASASWRTVGGRATPAARRARLAAGRGAERRRKCLPSCSTSVSVSESRSARTAGGRSYGEVDSSQHFGRVRLPNHHSGDDHAKPSSSFPKFESYQAALSSL